MTQDWLKNLKVGDKVFVTTSFTKDLKTVQRITPTGRVVVNNTQFVDGVNRSSMWQSIYLEEATDEAVERYNAVKFIKQVREALKNFNLTYRQAQEIDKILNLGIGEQK